VPDTSSPQATLQGFLVESDSLYTRWAERITDYYNSNTLYPTAEQRQAQRRVMQAVPNAIRALDLSEVPPVLRDTVGVERVLQFREILDRIDLPPLPDVPDAATMMNRPVKRWRLPGTEIDFVLVSQGPRTGEYLVSSETVERLPEFYRLVKDLPYKGGPALRVQDAYRLLRPGNTRTIYEIFSNSPIGLSYVIPMRWMLNWPDWARVSIGGTAVWQWIGIGVGILIGTMVLVLSHRLAASLSRWFGESSGRRWHALPIPIGILLVVLVLSPTVCGLLRLGGTPRVVIAVLETAALYLSWAWLALVGSGIVGEAIIGAQQLGFRSLDGQLIRLGSRLVGIIIAIACLIQGADELGFPAFSVLAGLGVGGLAVALAAMDSLANLFGSMLIMFEKPFRVGHHIRLQGTEGIVEDVGFRSTRIRTLDNSLISIPNDSVINTTVENLSQRPRRRQRFTVSVTYDTPQASLEAFVDGISQIILRHSQTAKAPPGNKRSMSMEVMP
jgi:MscS family membrane protein